MEDDPFDSYDVVINHEEQYSIWPSCKPVPLGWTLVGKRGPKAECLAHINEVWTDMRPKSLRESMARAAALPPEVPAISTEPELPPLVDRLSAGPSPVTASLRPEATAKALRERLDMGYVHIRFTNTRGGTELGVRLDRAASDWSHADFQKGEGKVHLEGSLTLNYTPVKCIADLDLATLTGEGRLVKL